jgi:hypothetical protein
MKFVARWVAVLALGTQLHAGFVHVWAIREIEDSPALVVATVEGTAIKELAPPGRPHSTPSDHYWEATLRVHRAYSSQPPNQDATITVRYISYGSQAFGSGPILPRLEPGYTALFPLKPGNNGQWQMVADEGFNLTVPAILGSPPAQQPPGRGRTFILGELANTLANGSAADRYAIERHGKQRSAVHVNQVAAGQLASEGTAALKRFPAVVREGHDLDVGSIEARVRGVRGE